MRVVTETPVKVDRALAVAYTTPFDGSYVPEAADTSDIVATR